MISTKHFNWNPTRREFSADRSDLGPDFVKNHVKWISRKTQCVDPRLDSIQGFTLVSERTNRTRDVVFLNTVRDAEGEILSWVYQSVNHEKGFKVVIFND